MYKQALLVENKIPEPKENQETFSTWDDVKVEIDAYIKRSQPVEKDLSAQYEVMCDNDHKIIEAIEAAREEFEFKGVLCTPEVDMVKLCDIYMQNMVLEEWELAEHGDDMNEIWDQYEEGEYC